jgi:hypothetical protein
MLSDKQNRTPRVVKFAPTHRVVDLNRSAERVEAATLHRHIRGSLRSPAASCTLMLNGNWKVPVSTDIRLSQLHYFTSYLGTPIWKLECTWLLPNLEVSVRSDAPDEEASVYRDTRGFGLEVPHDRVFVMRNEKRIAVPGLRSTVRFEVMLDDPTNPAAMSILTDCFRS